MSVRTLDSCVSEQGPVDSSCEQGNNSSNYIKGEKILDQPDNIKLVEKIMLRNYITEYNPHRQGTPWQSLYPHRKLRWSD
jgi:hypothetical protein